MVLLKLISDDLAAHLRSWGLRQFDSARVYERWQRDTIPAAALTRLNELLQRRSGPQAGAEDEIAFYDAAADPVILPVLYSQRYGYYLEMGAQIDDRVAAGVPLPLDLDDRGIISLDARLGEEPPDLEVSVLDVGCGVGILTTWYARRHPTCSFLGIDRSPISIAVARSRAAELKLANVRFECLDLDRSVPGKSFDRIVSTQALLQTEHDPGVPSKSWQTFERAKDAAAQADFERRTGLATRLDRLYAALAPDGRLIVCEKTRHLARRVPFQRAFAARGLTLLEPPLPIQYSIIEEMTDDGPLYVLGRTGAPAGTWDESPEQAGESVDVAALKSRPASPDEPLYENHTTSAQQVWTSLPDRRILQETTKQEQDGRQVHLELGESQGLTYLYCANTFDQRQLVIVKSEQASMLTQYYQELLQGLDVPAK